MTHQPLAAVLAASTTDTGFHPGPAFFVFWALVVVAIIGAPIYVVRLVRNRRKGQ
jgi:flagellar biogenesis protein FliO